MEDFTIAIYCFLDDCLKNTQHLQGHRRKLTDAEIITVALIAARFFRGNFTQAAYYLKEVHGFNIPHKSNLNRQLHHLSETIVDLFFLLGQSIKEMNTDMIYIIDSFPVRVCRNIRIPRCRLLQGSEYRGFNSSKKEYFYGFRVQVITTGDGIPVEFYLTAGVYHDVTAFQSMNIDLPAGSELYLDKGYTDYKLEDYYNELDDVTFYPIRKSNSKRKSSKFIKLWKSRIRKRIETTFSGICAYFPLHIQATTPEGFSYEDTFIYICIYIRQDLSRLGKINYIAT